jgi:hypothetical protein
MTEKDLENFKKIVEAQTAKLKAMTPQEAKWHSFNYLVYTLGTHNPNGTPTKEYGGEYTTIPKDPKTGNPIKVELREKIARIIAPNWFSIFPDSDPAINNYPGQHTKFQGEAYNKADDIIALIKVTQET